MAYLQLRSCGKVEVAVLSRIVPTVSVDVKQHWTWTQPLWTQELWESGGGRPVSNSPYGLCGRKATLNLNSATLNSGAVGMWRWPVDVKQHWTWTVDVSLWSKQVLIVTVDTSLRSLSSHVLSEHLTCCHVQMPFRWQLALVLATGAVCRFRQDSRNISTLKRKQLPPLHASFSKPNNRGRSPHPPPPPTHPPIPPSPTNWRFPEITGEDNLTVFSYSGRMKSLEWRRQRRRADLRQFQIFRHSLL